MTPDDLDTRLAALERRVPVGVAPPALDRGRRRARSRLIPLVVAPALALAVAASVFAGANIVIVFLSGYTDPSLATAGLECMTPPEAAAWLAAHGRTRVVWETVVAPGGVGIGGPAVTPGSRAAASPAPAAPSRVPASGGAVGSSVPGSGAAATPPAASSPIAVGSLPAGGTGTQRTVSSTPPATGVVLVGTVIDGVLHILVDQTPGAMRPASCPAQ